jgi:hypothetical protein
MTKRQERKNGTGLPYCEEKQRLSGDFVTAAHELMTLQSQQTEAVIAGDPDFARFDDLLHMAREKKDQAKYQLIAHVEEHHC